MKRQALFSALVLALAASASLAQPGTGPISGGGGSGGASGPADALAPAVVIEGATADGFEGNFTFTDPTADWTWTWGATGNLTAATAGTATAPAFKLPGGAAGWWDDWGTGGLAGSFASTTAFTLYSISGGTPTGSLYVDPNEVQLPTGTKLGWGTIGGAHDTGLVRDAAGIIALTNGNGGSGTLHFRPAASPPRTCDATAEGDVYADTSHALCFCDGTSWNVLTGSGAGACS